MTNAAQVGLFTILITVGDIMHHHLLNLPFLFSLHHQHNANAEM